MTARWPLAILVALSLISCTSLQKPEAPTGPTFTLLTYNVNWGSPELDRAVQAIQHADADIVCLQETTPESEAYFRDALSKLYPAMSFRPAATRRGGGLGFLAKVPGKEAAYVPSVTGWFDAWIMTFETPAGQVQVLNVHLQPPVSEEGRFGVSGYLGTDDEREREIRRFHQYLNDDVPYVIAGDFNDDDDSPALQWLKAQGMKSALPAFDRSSPTWHWETSVATLRRRLDHIVYSPGLHCYRAAVLTEGSSDHYPVVAELGVSPDRAPK